MSISNVSIERAIELCLQEVIPASNRSVAVEAAYGSICAQSFSASRHVPALDRSRMDGYAIHEQDIPVHSGTPVNLKCTGYCQAGEMPVRILLPGETWRVMTGAVLPPGTGAVIKEEETEVLDDTICLKGEIRAGQNIEKSGSVIKAGELILQDGQEITALDMEKAALAGHTQLKVYSRPEVYIINSGNELSMPGEPLLPGHIYNSNRSLFFGLVSSLGGQPRAGTSPVKDDEESIIREVIKGAGSVPLVIITGGTQQGDFDLVTVALEKLKSRRVFDGIQVRPGPRTSAWILHKTLIINLPGNPQGGYVLYHALVRPIINQLKGMRPGSDKWWGFPLAEPISSNASRCLSRGLICRGDNGQYQISLLGFGRPNTGIEAIVDIPAHTCRAGEEVLCLPVNW